MPGQQSPTPLLVLHAVRLLGVGGTAKIASRFGLPTDEVGDLLEDFRACGWVSHTVFGGLGGWSLTDAGRSANVAQLRAELDACGARAQVAAAHGRFLQLNGRFQQAATDWQLHPKPGDPLAANDHSDLRWDDRVIAELDTLGRLLPQITDPVAARLTRFAGYPQRYASAISRVHQGRADFVDGVGRQSCHSIWLQLHEDLLATLGLERGDEPEAHD